MAVFAVDAGGTRIKAAVVEGGQILARTALEARSSEGLERALPRLSAALRELVPSGRTIEGIGMAFPSLVDVKTGQVLGHSGKYRDAEFLDLPAWSEREFGVPFAIENDARMATIGEWRHGAGRSFDDLVMVTLGTGIGTGVVINGQVLRGRHGQAGCLGGHLVLRYGGRPCPCGGIGCAETEASTMWLPEIAASEPGLTQSRLSEANPLDYAAVFALAQEDDRFAVELRDRSLEAWGALAVSLVHAYDPEILVFGGGILAAGEAVLAPVREYVEKHAWTPWGKVRVVRSELGDDAALIACEWLVESRQAGEDEVAFA